MFEYADAVMLLRELADGHERRGDSHARASTCRRLALAHELRGQWESALTAREAAAVAFVAAGIPAEAAIDRLAMAAHLRAAASFSAALATLSAASADAQASGRTDLLLRIQGLRGNVLSRQGQPRDGIAALRSGAGSSTRRVAPGHPAELQQRLADALEHSGELPGRDSRVCRGLPVLRRTRSRCRRAAVPGLCQRGPVRPGRMGPHGRRLPGRARVGGRAARASGRRRPARPGARHAGSGQAGPPHLLESNLTATRIELTAMELLSSWGLCVLEDAAGAHGDAADRARQILARLARTQERHYSVPILQWTATFFTEQDLTTDTSACAAALSQIAEATAQPEAIAALAHARGETLLADQPEAAAHELSRAAEMFSRVDLPLQAAQAQRRAAAAAARLGEHARARELLHAAHATADQLGARHLRDSCTAALRQLGDTPRRHPYSRRVTAGLTIRELDIMQLVALGNTSRQIGHTLFISPRTVEMHVHSSMQKLQCRTRAQAVRRLTELRALPQPDAARQEPS